MLICAVQEIHEALLSVEKDAESMYSGERGLLDGSAQERDAMYAKAEQISKVRALCCIPTLHLSGGHRLACHSFFGE